MNVRYFQAGRKDTCDYCEGEIEEGEWIYWNPTTKLAYHYECLLPAEIGA